MVYNKLNRYKVYNLVSFDICVYTCEIITPIKIMNIFITLKSLPLLPCNSFLLTPIPRQALFFLVQISLHFLEFYINEIIKYMLFICLLSFTQLNCFEVHLCYIYQSLLSSFLFYCWVVFCCIQYHSWVISWFLAITKATMNICNISLLIDLYYHFSRREMAQ